MRLLWNYIFVLGAKSISADTNKFYLATDDGTLYRSSAGNIIDITQVKSYINSYSNLKYNVTLRYVNEYSANLSNNSHLNPITGCILVVDINAG